MAGAIRLLAIAAAVATLTLSGCATVTPTAEMGNPDAAGCVVPLVRVTPATVHPGDTITVVSGDPCDIPIPGEGWLVVAGHVGDGGARVHVTSDDELDGLFRVELTLPDDFPIGEAYAGIGNWDYSTCPDNASCAGPTGSFTVVP